MKLLARLLSSGLGSGYSKIAPGTCGTAVALIIWWAGWATITFGPPIFTAARVHSLFVSVCACAAVSIVGLWAIHTVVRDQPQDEGSVDPQWIVIDEWAGLLVALIGVGYPDLVVGLIAFAAFRFFDVTKLGPVGWAERWPGALGIMADDIVAGALAWIVVRVFVSVWY